MFGLAARFGVMMLSALVLAGCASPVATSIRAKSVVHAPVKQVASAKPVNRQSETLTLDPVGTGILVVGFKFPAKAYSVLATPDDVVKISVALKTKTFLLTKTLATADVTRAQMLNNKAAVQFTGLKGGSYTMDITAMDGEGRNIGATTAAATVTEGVTTNVDARLQIDRSIPEASLGVNLQIVNGQP